ncbi:MAG: bifunctional [glutamate--ammonia ligase]-adenylyl-L-tyrosine phosphorylase/[glutamate--ammonia-ligase] adenylyltransferase [Acidiferrobacterales bacterium]
MGSVDAKSVQDLFEHGLIEVPAALRAPVRDYWQQFCADAHTFALDRAHVAECLRTLPHIWACSDFVARACLVSPDLLADLIESGDLLTSYKHGTLTSRVGVIVAQARDEADLKCRLRRLRRREAVRVAWRDLAGWADLDEVLRGLSELADASIDAALTWLSSKLAAERGKPLFERSGKPMSMVVLGLGKLGGHELNFSSDVDLMFAYPGPGQTTGKHPLGGHEFFIQLGRRLINVLSEVTADGFVFRVDMRLRPNGSSGPLALGFDAMEHYYQTHGREWERYALIKSRIVAGDRAAGERLLERLRPFIYRKYVDYGAVQAIRDMKALINRELQRKGLRSNLKLGPGGIREIEFIGQAFQLIRGGREPSLQRREIIDTLQALCDGGHLACDVVDELTKAYRFLRNTENRLQMIADRQTHELPHDPLDQARLAAAMGFDAWQDFEQALGALTAKVQGCFDEVFAAPSEHQHLEGDEGLAAIWLGALDDDTADRVLAARGFDKPSDTVALLCGLRTGASYNALSSEGRARLDRLVPMLLAAASHTREPHTTMTRVIQLIEAIGRRSAYLVLLLENPTALSQLVNLCATSPWIASWISQHPILLDELIDPGSLYTLPTREALTTELSQRLTHVPSDDLESQMELLREFRHGHILRVAAADIGPGLAPEQVGAQLAGLADAVLDACLDMAKHGLVEKHGEPVCAADDTTGFAIVGYGKLGSLELGYVSDLDIIFLYETCDVGSETAGPLAVSHDVFFARLGQRIIHVLTTRTRAGLLYEVDMRLRPSGRAGALVTSLPAFRDYQRDRAWTWEHQALVRARPIAGKQELCERFANVRREILCIPRERDQLRDDVVAMRAKMVAAHSPHDTTLFDIKHDRGGIVDIEFMVQYWVLLWAARHPELVEHTDNISILESLANAGLLGAERKQLLVDAYRRYLSTEHHLKLTDRKSVVESAELAGLPDLVAVVWREVFESSSAAD